MTQATRHRYVVYDDQIPGTVSHDRQDETPEAKARWFQSLSLAERMELLCLYTDMILSVNPRITEQKHAKPAKGRILIVSEA